MNEIAVFEGGVVEQNLGYRAEIYTKSLTENTKRAYMRDILDFFGANDLSQVSIQQIQSVNSATAQEYRELLANKGVKLSTINRKLTSLSSFYSFLCRHEIKIMEYNPFSTKEGLRRFKQNKRYSNTRCLTSDEIKQLVKVTMEEPDDSANDRTKLEAIRNRIIILMLATTGMRRDEITGIKLGMIRQSHGKNVIEIIGKGDKERLVVISPTLKTMIDKYIEMRGLSYKDKDRYLLTKHTSNASNFASEQLSTQTVYRVVKSVAGKAGIHEDDISPHSLRHSFVTEALDMGYRFEDVADMVGHADSSTTKRYDHSKRVILDNPADKLEKLFME